MRENPSKNNAPSSKRIPFDEFIPMVFTNLTHYYGIVLIEVIN
jgi:hypothetical protein